MGTKYPGNSISGYNASPPSDDGTQVESNKVKWSYHKTKLADPIKTLSEAIDTSLSTWADLGPIVKSANYTTTAADHLKTIECTGTFTVTLGTPGTMGTGYVVTVKNVSTGTITVAGTINGGTNIGVKEDESITVQVDSGAGEYWIIGGKMSFNEFTQTPTVSGNTIWHAGNDGAASGLNADLLDGQHLSYTIARANHTGTQLMSTISNAGALATLNTVGQAQIDNNAIGVGELKTTFADVQESGSGIALKTLNTATLAFFPGVFNATTNGDARWSTNTDSSDEIMISNGNSFSRNIWLNRQGIGGGTAVMRMHYVQASPTYNLGDGPCGLFIYLMVDKQGNQLSGYCAPEAPFHFNPYSISKWYKNGRPYKWEQPIIAELLYEGKDPDIEMLKFLANKNERNYFLKRLTTEKPEEMEITDNIKNLHIDKRPHPFISHVENMTIVLIDPTSMIAAELFELHRQQLSVLEIVKDYVSIDNISLKRRTPNGCIVVNARWK